MGFEGHRESAFSFCLSVLDVCVEYVCVRACMDIGGDGGE